MSENDKDLASFRRDEVGRPAKRKIEVGRNLMIALGMIMLAIVAVVTLLSHQDPDLTKSVLIGCGLVAVFGLSALA
jgi:hypothetical protein